MFVRYRSASGGITGTRSKNVNCWFRVYDIDDVAAGMPEGEEEEEPWMEEEGAEWKRRGWIVVFKFENVVRVVLVVRGRDPFRRM